ncbi:MULTISPECIES: type II and III secretion system protein family protein [Rhodomicrobium]|uniref:type II and III secretion system protein family protein n=1 Tax=Rhodomicrobium TaxID=1068 RepID=UPI000B4B5841|nr:MULTISPECIES: type II and III secretion system protein family protein [Rhodomicrobium]
MNWALRILGGGGAERQRGRAGRRLLSGIGLAALSAFAAAQSFAGPAKLAKDEGAGRTGIYHVEPTDDRIDIKVTLHKSETVRVGQPFTEALVGNAEVADVVPLTDRAIYIVGKKIGVTRLALLDKDKQLLGVVDVEVTHDLVGLKKRMNTNPALKNVKVESVNGKILLTGVVPDSLAMQYAMTLAKQVSADEVTNAMRVAAPQQVMLEVRFIEAQRSAGRALGVSGYVQGGDVDGSFTEGGLGLITNSVPFGSLSGSIITGGTKISATVEALEERGLARRLAEPNLVALSGDTASFLAGGEFPFPVSADNDKVTVEFKKFGVGLAFTPTVLSEGQINLKIEPEVSELDPNGGITANGLKIPGLIVRRASTTVELRDGQTFAMAGLLQSNNAKALRQVPWLGDVPVLGALLRSANFEKKETDLVILVTPRLVQPRAPGQKIATPLDKTLPSNDREFFLRGKQEVNIGKPEDFTGHIIDWQDEAPVSGFKGAK